MSETKPPVAVADLPWKDWGEGVRFGGRTQTLSNTRDGGKLRIGVVIEELPPGKQSCPLHWHTAEEEHAFMLEGEVTVRIGEARHRFVAGQFVSFAAGVPIGHCFVNETDKTARYLVIGNNDPRDACIYPDSNKVALPGLAEYLFLGRKTEDYWDGERAGEPL